MTLGLLLTYIGVSALALTLLAGFLLKRIHYWLLSYLQFFVGALFVVSGWVKAIDPLGTAYKMQQYFAAFEGVFKGTAAAWVAPIFPALTHWVNGFAVGMIVFEIVLGVALLLGFQRRLTAWAFLLLVLFFTVLTGFTYLTGYVPEDVNFFDFSHWGAYVSTNMKVTDCGCFGDFMKLEPKVSFLKDVALLFPAVIFLLFSPKMHEIGTPNIRRILVAGSIPVFLLYCFSNYVWDLPHTDFRPFKVGVNIGARKQVEMEAAQNVKIVAYRITNKKSGQTLEIPFDQFLKEMANYPSEEWNMEQVKSEPAIAATKISEFDVTDVLGNDVTEELLTQKGHYFLIIAHHLEGSKSIREAMVADTIYRTDTIQTGTATELVRTVDKVVQKKVQVPVYAWDASYLNRWKEKVNPVLEEAKKAGVPAVAIVAYGSKEMIDSFKEAAGITYPVLIADDILLKTIIRSNPGPVFFKDGTILAKWHIRKFPDFKSIQETFIH